MSNVGSLPAVPHGRLIAIGLRRWKQAQLHTLLHALRPGRVHFARDAAQAIELNPGPADALLCWGPTPAEGLQALAERCGATIVRMEDGYLRSVGLGSDLIPPRSLVLDTQGLYMDPVLSRAGAWDPVALVDVADFDHSDTTRRRNRTCRARPKNRRHQATPCR